MNALPAARGWRARLELHFEASQGRTRIAHRRHEGPLVVQRAFYPERASAGFPVPEDGGLERRPAPASEPCHVYILHPPGGVASGDDLGVDVRVAPAAHALLTSPAAGKFYRRGAAGLARLAQALHVADGGVLEWLPNENIYFPDAAVAQGTRVDLDAGARFIGWELGCLGLPSQGRGLATGELGLGFELWRAGRPLLLERLRLDQQSLTARWGLGGCNAFGTWLGFPAAALDLERARASLPESCADMTVACTLVDGVLVCRALGMRADHVKHAFVGLWRALRPSLAGRSAGAAESLVYLRITMELTPREKDKLLLFTAALLAERRKARGLKLNYPESIALISAAILEGARDGRTVAELMSQGATVLRRNEVMEGVAEMITEVQVEATFPDGTKLVTVHDPIT